MTGKPEFPCRTNPDMWFSEIPEEVERAKDACLDCPLSRFNTCREEGWSHTHGVFGGLSSDDRRMSNPRRYEKAVKLDASTSAQIDKAAKTAKVRRALSLLSDGLTSREVGKLLGVTPELVRKWAYVSAKNA